jgi:hypothetical protein
MVADAHAREDNERNYIDIVYHMGTRPFTRVRVSRERDRCANRER